MQNFLINPVEMFASLWRNRELILASARREVLGRYRGSFMGLFWSVFTPLCMLAVYTFVFGEVFKARWGVENESKMQFALMLFAGLIVFNLFAECVNRAPNLILVNVNYVKKVVFPLEILPAIALASALFHCLISLGVWLLAYILFFGAPPLTVFYLPMILLPFAFMIMGVTWVLASLGVYLRDVAQFIGVLTSMFMFLSPIFYPATALPEAYRQILFLNPLTLVIEEVRAVLFFGRSTDFVLLAIYWIVTLMFAWLGFIWFQKTRKGFADVL